MLKKQKGFAALETLLILVIIAVIGGIGWYAYNSKSKTDKILSQADKISQSTPIKSPNTSSNSTNKLLIKEYGVQLPIPSDFKGLEYTARNGTSISGQPATFIYFTSDEFKSFLKSCNSQHINDSYFAGANKVNGTYPTNPTPENSDGALLKQFPTFYVEGSADQQSAPCQDGYGGDSAGAQALVNERSKLTESLIAAFKGATLAE